MSKSQTEPTAHTDGAPDPSLQEIQAKMESMEEAIKEREISLLRALRTLMQDYSAFTAGEREDFPRAALLGVVFAYLRRRLIVVVGSLAALVFGVAQIGILMNQNTLIEQQNSLLQGQAEADRAQAVAALLSGLDATDSIRTRIAVAQLIDYGGAGVAPLIRLAADYDSPIGSAARTALSRSASSHSFDEMAEVAERLLDAINVAAGSDHAALRGALQEARFYVNGILNSSAMQSPADSTLNLRASLGLKLPHLNTAHLTVREGTMNAAQQGFFTRLLEDLTGRIEIICRNRGEADFPTVFEMWDSIGVISDSEHLVAGYALEVCAEVTVTITS